MLNNVCHHDKYIMSNMTDKMKNRNRKTEVFQFLYTKSYRNNSSKNFIQNR